MQDSLREAIAEIAQRNGIDSIEKLAGYYYPTPRQRGMIDKAAAKYGFQDGWARVFVSDKFGEATTHWRKLMERVERGVGNPCPLVLIGIPRDVLVF